MKRLKKFFKIAIILFLFFIIALGITAKVAEDKIADLATKKIGEIITAPIEIDNVSFTLIRRFPLATIEFNGLRLGMHANLHDSVWKDQVTDTLASIDNFFVSVRVKPLLKKKLDIVKVELKKGHFNYLVAPDGSTSLDFLLDTTKTKVKEDTPDSNSLNLLLKEVAISEIVCHYNDSSRNVRADLSIPKLYLEGSTANNIFIGSSKGKILIQNMDFGQTNIHRIANLAMDIDLNYDTDSVYINELLVDIDGATIGLIGSVLLKQGIHSDIQLIGQAFNLEKMLKLAPDSIQNKIGLKRLEGMLSFDAGLKGDISDSIMPHIEADIVLKNGLVEKAPYPVIKNIQLKASATNGFLNNKKTAIVQVKSLYAEAVNAILSTSFSLQDLTNPKYQIESNLDLELSALKPWIPDSAIRHINGRLKTVLKTQGQLPDSIDKKFVDYLLENSIAQFDMKHLHLEVDSGMVIDSLSGTIKYQSGQLKGQGLSAMLPNQDINLKKTSFNALMLGKISAPKSLGVDLKSLYFEEGNNRCNVSAKVINLEPLDYNVNVNLDLDLLSTRRFLPDSIVHHATGAVRLGLRTSGQCNIDSIGNQIMDLLYQNSSLDMRFADVDIAMADTLYHVENLNGIISYKNDQLNLKRFVGKVKGITFNIDSTEVSNIYASIIKKEAEPLKIAGVYRFGDIDYTALGAFISSDTTSIETPEDNVNDKEEESGNGDFRYDIKGRLHINSLKYQKALFENLSGKISLTNDRYVVDKFELDAFDGHLVNSIRYEPGDDGRANVWVKNRIERMNVTKLLYDFDNFGQTSLTHEQLDGLISTNLDGKFVLQDFVPYSDSTKFRGNITMENGGLYDFEEAQIVAKFTGIDELDNIKFETIKSDVFIHKNAIYVPKTDINTTSMDITAYGMQTFGEDYEYHLRIYLGEVLLGKTRRIRKKQDDLKEFEDSDDTGLKSLFLVSFSENGKSGVKLDNRKMQQKMTNKIKVRETLHNVIFNPLLIDFKTGVE